MRARLLVCCSLLLATACVTPARSFDTYVGKATGTAEAVLQAVGTAQLGFHAAVKSQAFGPYLGVLVAKAEDDANAATGTFDSIQPPDSKSDALHEQLSKVFDDATTALRDLRIAARRGDLNKAQDEASQLTDVSAKLTEFIEAQQR